MKQLNEVARIQQLAGITEIKVNNPNGIKITSDYGIDYIFSTDDKDIQKMLIYLWESFAEGNDNDYNAGEEMSETMEYELYNPEQALKLKEILPIKFIVDNGDVKVNIIASVGDEHMWDDEYVYINLSWIEPDWGY